MKVKFHPLQWNAVPLRCCKDLGGVLNWEACQWCPAFITTRVTIVFQAGLLSWDSLPPSLSSLSLSFSSPSTTTMSDICTCPTCLPEIRHPHTSTPTWVIIKTPAICVGHHPVVLERLPGAVRTCYAQACYTAIPSVFLQIMSHPVFGAERARCQMRLASASTFATLTSLHSFLNKNLAAMLCLFTPRCVPFCQIHQDLSKCCNLPLNSKLDRTRRPLKAIQITSLFTSKV